MIPAKGMPVVKGVASVPKGVAVPVTEGWPRGEASTSALPSLNSMIAPSTPTMSPAASTPAQDWQHLTRMAGNMMEDMLQDEDTMNPIERRKWQLILDILRVTHRERQPGRMIEEMYHLMQGFPTESSPSATS